MPLEEIVLGARFAPVILAGGSGTRFWPRSRKARAKQVLALDGEQTMIQQTLARLSDLAPAEETWVITNDLLRGQIAQQLPHLATGHILCEPAARNTAPACALAAFLLERREPDTVVGIFPSDHVVKDSARFREVIRAGVAVAAGGDRVVVLGVPPTRPETGYGYIEKGVGLDPQIISGSDIPVHRVKRFTEKPDLDRAKEFLASGNYAWNSGIFLWKARTLADSIRHFRPSIAPLLEQIADAYGTDRFQRVFEEIYPRCENISIDYAVLEPRSAAGELKSEIYCLPADFEWNDLGSWDALYEHKCQVGDSGGLDSNVIEAESRIALEAEGNYIFAPGKTVALLGVQDVVVVVTDDAVLVTTRGRSQDVGKLTKALADAQEDCI